MHDLVEDDGKLEGIRKHAEYLKLDMKWADSIDCCFQARTIWSQLNKIVNSSHKPLEPIEGLMPEGLDLWNELMGFVDDMPCKLSFTVGMFSGLKLHGKISLRRFLLHLLQAMTH